MKNRLETFIDFLEKQSERTGMDWELEFDIAHECAWGGELRLTPKPNVKNKPDESIVLYVAGGANPDHLVKLLKRRTMQVVKRFPTRTPKQYG